MVATVIALADASPATAAEVTLSPGLVGALAAAIGVPIAFALLRRMKAYGHVERSDPSFEKLRARYGRWDRFGRVISIPIMFGLAFACWKLLCWIEAIRASFLSPANFVLTPITIFFAIPSLFVGILITALAYRLILSSLLGADGYMHLIHYQSLKRRFDTAKAFRHMVYVVAPVTLASVLLAFRTFAVATEENLVLHPYFAVMERTYSWKEIHRVLLVRSFQAPNGNIRRDRPYFSIQLIGGDELNFHRTILETPFREQQAFAAFVTGRAHLAIETEDPFPASP